MGAPLLAGVTRELGLFALAGLLIGGLDDLAIDMLWIGRGLWRRVAIFTRVPRGTLDRLPPPARHGPLAIFIPAWDESRVIGAMVRAALGRLVHADYRIYVGTYPNDPATVRALEALADPRIRIVPGDRPGPTTKAECLNRVWRAMLADEQAAGAPVKAVVLHDAEDVMHPQELALYDRMVERFDLVQIPVVPLPSPGGRWNRLVSLTYGDEFAEAHGKMLAIRETIGAAVPSAGVGCAIARDMLARIADARGGDPFDESSLTEDYELGLAVRSLGGRGAFVTLPAEAGKPPIAVHAHFPDTIETAVRQKTRWIIGIALAGWDRLRWEGGLAERWMRLRDRRSILAALLLVAAYAAFALALISQALGVDPRWPPLAVKLFRITGALLVWRLAVRMVVVTRTYGWREGVASLPRVLVGNLIDVAAARRAITAYMPGHVPRWDKTSHHFPETLPCD